MESIDDSLLSRLSYEPRELKFGTSGRRGEAVHLTQLEVYINVLAELRYLKTLTREQGGIRPGDEFYFGYDLRPTSTRYVADVGGRGEIAQAIVRAVEDAQLRPVNLGRIPTPAVMLHAVSRGRGSIMVTGSHIPFDRNGYKTNTSIGELLKCHEEPIAEAVRQLRSEIYRQPFATSLFDEDGRFKTGHHDLPPESVEGKDAYVRRYVDFFGGGSLRGMRVIAYQHSAIGRDILVEILARLGAEAIPAGRSETFVPIDTENIDTAQLATIQALVDAHRDAGRIDAVVSTDGDSDRPLILGCDAMTGQVRFFPGDLVGMIVAEYLGADAVVVPISCNDAIDRSPLREFLEPKTRIGSPHVISAMERARSRGRQRVCGWEANGGFLTASPIERRGRTLAPLATRDAMLPILGVLFAARENGVSLEQLFARLPARFSRSALLKNFPRPVGDAIVRRFSPADGAGSEFSFEEAAAVPDEMRRIRDELAHFFTAEHGFAPIVRLNYTDGVRITFANGDVVHLRPSGNADEFRVYAVSDTQQRAQEMAALGIAEPDGILRRMERSGASGPCTDR